MSGSLDDENTGLGGKAAFGQWLDGSRLLGRKISEEGVQGTRGALEVRKPLLFPDYLQPNCRMDNFFLSPAQVLLQMAKRAAGL